MEKKLMTWQLLGDGLKMKVNIGLIGLLIEAIG